MGRFAILWSAIFFLAGTVCTSFDLRILVICSASIAIALTCFRPWQRAHTLALVAFACGAIDALVLSHPLPTHGDLHVHRFAATLVEIRPDNDGQATLTLRLSDGVLATMISREAAPPIGSRLLVRAKRDVFDEPRNPGEPSERELQAERGISWRLVEAKILAQAPVDTRDPSLWIARLRAWASQRLHASIEEPGATILAGAMWGERGELPPDLRSEFQDTGTVHILVTAGLHLGVVAALALGLLRVLRFGRVSASLLTIAIVWTYAAFSGDHLPSVRAATMLSFGLIAHAVGRQALSWNALGAAAIVIAAVDPNAVRSVSFALSFSCVAAILAFSQPIARAIADRGAPKILAELAAVSFATQIGTWPLTASAFLVIAPYAPLANLAVVPVVGVVMLVGFAALATSPIPIVSAALGNTATSLLEWIALCVRDVAALPGAHVIATPPPLWTIAIYDVTLVAATFALTRRRYVATSFALVALSCGVCLWPPRPVNHDLTVTAIDVGQADALLVRTPTGHAYLIDAGGRLERGGPGSGASTSEAIGERVVVPFLIREGIHHLDAILLSHPHGDHAGGVAPVLRILGANGFADSGQSYPGHAYRDALDVAKSNGTPMLEPRGGDVWRTDDGVTFLFYGPTRPYITGSRSDINSNSLVFRLEYGRTSMLFTGDAGAETEQRLLNCGVDLRADVLKVGHHGSAYGTTPAFVRAIGASIAIISVGRHNLFGHPAPSTIKTLEASGARVYRTDEDGATAIQSDGTRVSASALLRSSQPSLR